MTGGGASAAVALAVAAGCSAAGAAPSGSASGAAAVLSGSAARGPAPPAGWKPLPTIAAAVGAAAKADGVTIDLVDAWGEPAAGCYAVWLTLHSGDGTAPQLAEQVLASLDAGAADHAATGSSVGAAGSSVTPAALALSELVAPSDPIGELTFRFARPPYRGRVRARLGHGQIAAVTCFANQREPIGCEAVCSGVLQTLPTAPGALR